VAQRLSLFNLLVNNRKVALNVLSVLLVEWGHSKLLMHKSLLLPPVGPIAVVAAVSELQPLVVFR
jgi:hypothetical protein